MGLDNNYGIGKKIKSLGLGLFMFFTWPNYFKDNVNYNLDFFYESLPLYQIKSDYYAGGMGDRQLIDLFDDFKKRFNEPEAVEILDEIRDKTIAGKKILEISGRKYEKVPAPRVEKNYKTTGTMSSVKHPDED